MISFEWDPKKADANLAKHQVSFEEAKSIFFDEYALQYFDEDNSSPDEDRFLMLGWSNLSRVLVVSHCERDADVIRIISARKATKNERVAYAGPMK